MPINQPIKRPAGRVVVLDPRDRVLLLRCEDLTTDIKRFWMTPGGGCEPNESFRQAARRELWEETGISASSLGPCVWDRRHTWRWGERMIASHERYYLLRLDHTPSICPGGVTPEEQNVIQEHRWWTQADLHADQTTRFVPFQLAQLIPALIAGPLPREPVSVGG